MAGRATDKAVMSGICHARRAGLKTVSPRALELFCVLADRRGRGLPTLTYRQMRSAMGVKGRSLKMVTQWLEQLRDVGWVEWEKGNAKTLRILVRIEAVRHDAAAAIRGLTCG
jgi:predicted transcriptional regulator